MNTRGKQRNRKIRYSLYDYLKMLFTFVHLMLYLKSETNNFGEIQMAHTDYYYEFGDHMPDGSPDTRWQTAPARGLNRTHDALVNGAIGVIDGARAVKDFAGNTTFNPLPYGEYAQSAYDGMQNLYGNALDDGMNSVIDYVNPQPDMMSGGPMSRNTKRTPSLNRVRASLGDNEIMPLAEQRYLAEMDYYNSPLTEAEMGSSPYQEQDTGPGLMMSGGPMTRNGYRHYPGGYVIPANASLTEAAQEERDYQGFNGRAGHPHTPANYPDRPEFSREYHDDKRKNSQKPKSDWAKWKASMNSGRS